MFEGIHGIDGRTNTLSQEAEERIFHNSTSVQVSAGGYKGYDEVIDLRDLVVNNYCIVFRSDEEYAVLRRRCRDPDYHQRVELSFVAVSHKYHTVPLVIKLHESTEVRLLRERGVTFQ